MRLFFVLVFSGTLIVPQEAAKSLDGRIKAGIAGFKGHVSIYAKNLATGTTYSLAGDDPVRTASTIKFPIMIECFAEAGEGASAMAPSSLGRDSEVAHSPTVLGSFSR